MEVQERADCNRDVEKVVEAACKWFVFHFHSFHFTDGFRLLHIQYFAYAPVILYLLFAAAVCSLQGRTFRGLTDLMYTVRPRILVVFNVSREAKNCLFWSKRKLWVFISWSADTNREMAFFKLVGLNFGLGNSICQLQQVQAVQARRGMTLSTAVQALHLGVHHGQYGTQYHRWLQYDSKSWWLF